MVSDSNETQKDTPPEKGQTSTEGKETSGNVDIFTKADVDKIKSDMQAAHGREKQTLERKSSSYESELTSVRQEIASIREEADRKAYEAVKDDPSGLTAYKREQEVKAREKALRDERVQFDKDKAEHTDLLAASEKAALLLAVSDIATEYGVNKNAILRFNPTSPENAKEIAQAVKDLGSNPQGVKSPDSGLGSGAGTSPKTAEEIVSRGLEKLRTK